MDIPWRKRVAVVAVSGDDVIVRAQQRAGPDRHALLADVEVQEAAHLPLLVVLHCRLLEAADAQHVAQEADLVFRRKRGVDGRGKEIRGFDSCAHKYETATAVTLGTVLGGTIPVQLLPFETSALEIDRTGLSQSVLDGSACGVAKCADRGAEVPRGTSMFNYPTQYDVIVIGAGHAGIEAAMAASRLGCKTLILTQNLDSVGQMSCNPAIGGQAKGQMVREIDALGGFMGLNTDATAIQFRMLNASKGPSVRSPRAQCDKKAYQFRAKAALGAAAESGSEAGQCHPHYARRKWGDGGRDGLWRAVLRAGRGDYRRHLHARTAACGHADATRRTHGGLRFDARATH